MQQGWAALRAPVLLGEYSRLLGLVVPRQRVCAGAGFL